MHRADAIIVNRGEFEAVRSLRECPLVVVTLGAAGAVVMRRGRTAESVPGFPTTVVSTVGAGDAFAAAFALGMMQGDSIQFALTRACKVGAAAVADPRSQPELESLHHYS